MWLILSMTSAMFAGFTSIVMKKCMIKNLSIRISLLGLLIGNIAYVIIGLISTDVINNFNMKNLIFVINNSYN